MINETLSADGDTAQMLTNSMSPGVAMYASGTWGGGTLTLTVGQPDGTFYSIPAAELTADGTVFVDIPGAANVRATLAGATSPSLTVILV